MRFGLCSFAALILGTIASPQVGPDVYVYDVGYNFGDTNDFHYWGQNAGIAAYSVASQSCNSGDAPVSWRDSGPNSTKHPVIGQNIFRLKNGRFEQLGQSWLKHGFCAVDESETSCSCGTPDGNCDWLAVGCADTYWATLNDGGGGRSKRFINATSGGHTDGGPLPAGNATIRGRLQVAVADIDPAQNPGAIYWAEIHYVTEDDHLWSNGDNNASYRRLSVVSVSNVNGSGGTIRKTPAIYAWQDIDPLVEIVPVQTFETDGKGRYYLGYRVTEEGGLWRYEYAIQNLYSDQSATSFSVPVDPAVTVTNVGFHDVNYHSGDPYDNTDWTNSEADGELTWEGVPYATNVDANALRWGTLYNFSFYANWPPTTGTVTLGLFKPGPSSEVEIPDVLVPSTPIPNDTKIARRVLPEGPNSEIEYYPTVSRNGGHFNPRDLSELLPAAIGQEWAVSVGNAADSVLLIGLGGPTEGNFTKLGEVLIRPPVMSQRGSNTHQIRIPDDPMLVGFKFSAQALEFGRGGWQLTNALDVTIGN
jgi:hypothetical protein